jgi:hypothetical protein
MPEDKLVLGGGEEDQCADLSREVSLRQVQKQLWHTAGREAGRAGMSRVFLGRGYGMDTHNSTEWKKLCAMVSVFLV